MCMQGGLRGMVNNGQPGSEHPHRNGWLLGVTRFSSPVAYPTDSQPPYTSVPLPVFAREGKRGSTSPWRDRSGRTARVKREAGQSFTKSRDGRGKHFPLLLPSRRREVPAALHSPEAAPLSGPARGRRRGPRDQLFANSCGNRGTAAPHLSMVVEAHVSLAGVGQNHHHIGIGPELPGQPDGSLQGGP